MTAGFWLRVNGKWLPLEGVQAGVPVRRDRPASELVTLGGRRSVSRAKRGPREWSLNLSHATPEAVRWLELAANGQAGDVALLDMSAVRSNMLDPLVTTGLDESYQLLPVDGVPLRSVVSPTGATDVTRITATSSASVSSQTPSTPQGTIVRVEQGTYLWHGYLRFPIPMATPLRTLMSSRLILAEGAGTPSGTSIVRADSAGNAWVESSITWNTTPTIGALLGSGSASSGKWSIALSDLAAAQGTDLTVRLSLASTGSRRMQSRLMASPPQLEMTYAALSSDHLLTHQVRGGIGHLASGWTNVAAGQRLGVYEVDGVANVILAPSGTGPRRFVIPFLPGVDGRFLISIDGEAPGLVSGLRLTEGIHDATWLPGRKTPCSVSVSDPDETLNFLLDLQPPRSDYQITVKEVG